MTSIYADILPSENGHMTKNKDTKKEYRFGEVVKELIIDNYGTEVSVSETKVIESKLIEYAAKGNYDIYVSVACGDWVQDFKVTSEDLLRFVRKPRSVVKIEKLFLYTEANDALGNLYHEVVESDEYGIIHDCPKVSKTFRITTDMFRILEEDIPLLKEKIKNYNLLDLKVKQGEIKVEKKKKRRQRIPDDKFRQLCKEVDKYCTRASGEIKYFKKLSEMSISTIYDKTGRGYTTWQSAKKRYYEVFLSKKTN